MSVISTKTNGDTALIGVDDPTASVRAIVMADTVNGSGACRLLGNRHRLIVGALTPVLSMG